jgi:hypothetical protein
MPLKLQSSSGGSVTLDVPVTASNYNLTIPKASGTAMVSGNMPTFRANTYAAQSFSSGTWTKIGYSIVEWDSASCYDNLNNYRFTPNVAGYYQMSGGLLINSNQIIYLVLYKNGSPNTWFAITGSATVRGAWGSGLVYANGSTDYFEMYTYLGGSATLNGDSAQTWFSGYLARAA